MNEHEREMLHRLNEFAKFSTETLAEFSASLRQLMADNAVLTTVCGALYAELAQLSNDEHALDIMLSRISGVIEPHPDSEGRVLHTIDQIRTVAEVYSTRSE